MRIDHTSNAWLNYSKNDRKELKELSDSYIEFLSKCKTEEGMCKRDRGHKPRSQDIRPERYSRE